MFVFTRRLPEIPILFCSMNIHSVYLIETEASDYGNNDSFNDIGKFGYDRY